MTGEAGSAQRYTALMVAGVGAVSLLFFAAGNSISATDSCTKACHEWAEYIDGPAGDWDVGNDVAVDDAGNAYVVGYVTGLDGDREIFVAKYDTGGGLVWLTTTDVAAGDDVGENIQLDGSGSIYVLARGGGDILLLKYDTGGSHLWTAAYDGGYEDVPREFRTDEQGTSYIVGYTFIDPTDADLLVASYDADGNEVWTDTYGLPDVVDSSCGLALLDDATLYVAGRLYTDDVVVLKYDATGSLVWSEVFDAQPGPGDWCYDLAADASGNLYVSGGVTGPVGAVSKIDSNGNVSWTAQYPLPNLVDPLSLVVDQDGDVYIAGDWLAVSGASDIYTAKLDSATGDEVWSSIYSGPLSRYDYQPWDLALSDDSLYMAAWSYSNQKYYDTVVLSYDLTSGSERWAAHFDGPFESSPEDIPGGIAVVFPYVFVTGYSREGTGGSGDVYTVMYNEADTDGDEMPDFYEDAYPCVDGNVPDAALDPDNDGLTNLQEVTTYTNPCIADSDGDGCIDGVEIGPDEKLGGLRSPANPWDFYDVLGFNGAPPDGVVDLTNDILGVILHYSPSGYVPGAPAVVGSGVYDDFDRGPSYGPYPWSMTAPDGAIDLADDILGVILQYGHSCQ